MDRLRKIRSQSGGSILEREISIDINRDVIAAIVFLLITAVYATEVVALPAPFERGNAGPGLYPAMLTGIMAVCSTYLLVTGLRKEEGIAIEVEKYVQPAAYIVLTAIYVETFLVFGYVASTLVYTFGVALVFEAGRRPLPRAVGLSAVIAVLVTGIGLVFFEYLFNVRLPDGVFGGVL